MLNSYDSLEQFDDFDFGPNLSGLMFGPGGGFGGLPGGSDRGVRITLPLPGGSGGGVGPNVNRLLTAIVNEAERALQTNLGAFQTGAKDAQTAYEYATQLFDQMIATLMTYGQPGEKAATERDRRINPAQLVWDWIAYYIDPIYGSSSTPPGPSIPPRVPPRGPDNPSFTTPGTPPLFQPSQRDNTLLIAVVALAVVFLLKK